MEIITIVIVSGIVGGASGFFLSLLFNKNITTTDLCVLKDTILDRFVTSEKGFVLDKDKAETVKVVYWYGGTRGKEKYFPLGEKPLYDVIKYTCDDITYYKNNVEVTEDGKIKK